RLRSVRMLVAVCRAQTDKIYMHLDEHGVSVGLVYQVERMRAQLTRVSKLIELRAAADSGAEDVQLLAQTLLGDLIVAHHHRASIGRLVQRSFSLVARKMVERHAQHGELYLVTNRLEYRSVLKAAGIGGVIVGLAMVGRLLLPHISLAGFFQGVLVSVGYMLVFLVIAAFGGILAAQQSAVAAPALAAHLGSLDTPFEMRAVQSQASGLLRVQSAGLVGNLVLLIPVILLSGVLLFWFDGQHLLSTDAALQHLRQLSVLGFSPLFAIWTGVLLCLAGLAAGFADNWFALRQMHQALAQHRRLVRVFGAMRAVAVADWLERNLARIVGAVVLGLLFGMTPVVAQFFGLTLDVRHVSFAAASLAAAAASLGWTVALTTQFWLALAGVVVIGILNVGVAFAGALALASSARGVPTRRRWLVARALLYKLITDSHFSLWPRKQAEQTHSKPLNDPTMEVPDRRSHAQR
ncbi:MAG: preprotein translocase subunit TatB, partial [Herbaspirillum sp.]